MNIENWRPLGAIIVGIVLVATSLMKVAAPFSFYRHVARLGLKIGVPLRIVVPFAIGFEGAWGTALLIGLAPHFTLPMTALGLMLLTGLTWWSIRSGKTEDCGCYGGFITPSIAQSVALNGLYFVLVALAWASLPPESVFPMWKVGTVILAGILIGGTAEYALGSEFRTGVPLFTPSPLKVGQRWRRRWAGSATLMPGMPQILSYLGPDCPYCQRWVRALNIIHESPDLPQVTAILASSQGKIEDFVKETGVRFPIATIPQARMQRLASLVPTTVLVENDVIQDVWGGAQLSEDFSERFKAAFFPSALPHQGKQFPLSSVEQV
jgi:hypothetical protein